MTRHVLAGLAFGIGWGVLARVFMRMVSTEHGFSWSGTLFIVGLAAVAGLGMGLVRGARLTGRSRWWRLCALLAFPLVASPQGVLVFTPGFLLGGVALSGRWPQWLRGGALAVVLAMPLVFWFASSADERVGVPGGTMVLGLALLALGLAVGGAELFRRWTAVLVTREEPVLVA